MLSWLVVLLLFVLSTLKLWAERITWLTVFVLTMLSWLIYSKSHLAFMRAELKTPCVTSFIAVTFIKTIANIHIVYFFFLLYKHHSFKCSKDTLARQQNQFLLKHPFKMDVFSIWFAFLHAHWYVFSLFVKCTWTVLHGDSALEIKLK